MYIKVKEKYSFYMALNMAVKVLGTLVDILAQMHLGNYNFSLLSATSLCDHPQNLSAVAPFN